MILKSIYVIKCKDCSFVRKSSNKEELAEKRDKHKGRRPTHRIVWYVRELSEVKITSNRG